MTAIEAYILARAYTRQAIEGAGALKGAPCQIQSIEAITGGNRITFAWETGEGETETDTLDVMDGADGNDGVGIASITYKETDAQGNNVYTVTLTSGSTYDITCPKGAQGETGATGATGNGIVSIAKTSTEGLVDTYTITYTNGSTSTFTVTNGATQTVDSEMSESSENPLQNKVITAWTSAETKSVTGNPITITDAAAVKAKALSVSIDPVQDLHGYDKPWVGGAGYNKLDVSGNSDFPVDDDGYVSDATPTVDSRGWNYSEAQYKLSLPAGNYKAVVIVKETTSDGASGFRIMTTPYSELVNNWDTFKTTGTKVYNFTLSDTTDIGVEAKMLSSVARFMILPQSVTSNDWQPYTNICPISGHTEASVQRDGKNLAQLEQGTISTFTGEESESTTRVRTQFIAVEQGVNYIASSQNNGFEVRNGVGYDENFNFVVSQIYPDSTGLFVVNNPSIKYVRFIYSHSNTSETCTPTDYWYQFEKGSTPTAYEPYQGKTYTIQLGDTIYGGTVDFDSGVMTVDRGFYVFDGSASDGWMSQSHVNRIRTNKLMGVAKNNTSGAAAQEKLISNRYKAISPNSSYYGVAGVTLDGEGAFFLSDGTSDMTTSDLLLWLAENPLQVCYELATPFTVQLTPSQIQLLKGINTLTGNGASISLTYQQDNLVGEVMEQVEPQIDDLQGQIDEIPRPLDYSTTEQKTGQKWIDGKDIYVRTFDYSSSPITLVRDSFVATGIDASGFASLIDAKVYAPDEAPLGFVETTLDGSGAEKTVKLQLESYANLTRTCNYLVLEYTKLTT